MLFRISKISTFESNSQREPLRKEAVRGCSEYQRYQLLRAIHNAVKSVSDTPVVVPNIKDINFWEQFTTASLVLKIPSGCSEYQRYQLLRAIHNEQGFGERKPIVVPNIKDINFWEQFTTRWDEHKKQRALFRISKISTFESNSQPYQPPVIPEDSCSEYQRYQLLRAIHN